MAAADTTVPYDVTTTSDVNATNTTEYAELNQALYITYNVMIITITVVIMLSMGSSITLAYLKIILIRPVGPIIGFVCQVGIGLTTTRLIIPFDEMATIGLWHLTTDVTIRRERD